MTKQTFKKICAVLLLAAGLIFVSSHDASAGIGDRIKKAIAGALVGGLGDANAEMSAFCDTYSKNLADYSGQHNCWSCEMFVLLFDAANVVSGQICNALSKPAMNLVIVGGCLWLAFITLAFFGNINDAPDPMEYLTNVGKIMLRVGFAGCFLAGGASVAFNYIVNPVLTSGAQLASTTLSMTGTRATLSGNIASTNGSSGPMGAGVRDSLKQMISQMASGMAKAQAIAQGLRCGAFFWKKLSFGAFIPLPDMLIPNPLMWVVGSWLGCVFWIVAIMFCMAMLDVIFRIGLLVGMLPVFIAAWVFPITGEFAKTAWELFLNSVLVFFVTAIIAAFVILLSDRAWDTGSSGSFGSFVSMMQSNAYVDAWDKLFEGGITTGLTSLFIVTCVAMWAWMISPKADSTASTILGSSFSSSVANKALHATIDILLDIVMFAFTIITGGLAACMYILRFARILKSFISAVDNLQKYIDKMKKIQEKAQKIKEKAQKAKEAVQKAKNQAIPTA